MLENAIKRAEREKNTHKKMNTFESFFVPQSSVKHSDIVISIHLFATESERNMI